MSEVEHHWHTPTQGQVYKAIYQWLTDQGLNQTKVMEIVDKKVAQYLQGTIDRWVNTGKFDKMLLDALAEHIQSEKKRSEGTAYPFASRLEFLLREKMKEVLLEEYQVTITKKT